MDDAKDIEYRPCGMTFGPQEGDTLVVRLEGSWKLDNELPAAEDVLKQVEASTGIKSVAFNTQQITEWDSALLTFLTKVIDQCSQLDISVDQAGLPEGVQRLLKLASAVPEKKDTGREGVRESFLYRVGESTLHFFRSAGEMLNFIGDASAVFLKFLLGKARFRRSDLMLIIQEVGADALPIVSLISVLVGLIFAFVGAVQLKMFGAEIFVANLVAISMVRVMGAIMTGIIMAGRTGAAFAAQLGTMQVNEELDALTTLGVSPMEFLVLPRMLALVLMMPLLCLYADLMGILGGMIVGVGMLDLNPVQYLNQTEAAVRLQDFLIGLFHGAVFGVLVAVAGCLRGMQCGRSASAVGQAATSAVVTGIVSIIVTTGIITVVCDVLRI
jgi:phospholipid/cholesterol/gamma-HCH transport system permease protein